MTLTRHVRANGWPSALAALLITLAAVGAATACSPRPDRASSPPTYSWEARQNALRIVAAAALRGNQLPAGLTASNRSSDLVGYRLMPACGSMLVTDRQMPVFDVKEWSAQSGLPIIEQSIAGYAAPVAAAAVAEAARGLTCSEYRTRAGTYHEDGALELPAPRSGSQFGFCETFRPDEKSAILEVCTVIVGGGSVACAVRTWEAGRDPAAATLRGILPAIQESCIDSGHSSG